MEIAPLERAARALAVYDGLDPDKTYLMNDESKRFIWQEYLPHARAVLMAIREPSLKILEAGYAVAADRADETDWQELWQAMIDAALEGPNT